MISRARLAVAGLVYHRRPYLAIALGVIAGTAVLTGALVVGDSVRGSLRDLALARLGNIDFALVTNRFFREALAGEQKSVGLAPEPAIVVEASLEAPGSHRRANHVTLVGCSDAFFANWPAVKGISLAAGGVLVNEEVARDLAVATGEDVLVRIGAASDIPPDSPLGRKTDNVRTRRLKVDRVLPAEGPGQFTLRPSQQANRIAYVPLATVQAMLEQPGKANAIFLSSTDHHVPAAATPPAPTLEDYGIELIATPRDYINVTSDRMLFDPTAERALDRPGVLPGAQPVLSYLANTIAAGDRQIPYSIVAALNPLTDPPLGPLRTTAGEDLKAWNDDQIVLNRWAADDLEVAPGDKVRLVYFEPDSTHGTVREATAEFTLAAVVELEGAAADKDLTPELKGVTDETSIADWNPPFPFDAKRIRSEDEAYWDKYRATPKAFVTLAAGRRMWGSRFGQTTSFRVPMRDGLTVDALAKRIQLDPAEFGFRFEPIRALQLAAARGTTSFSGLFLGFSAFVILAAVLLVGALFRLAIEARASEIGLLAAVGFSTSKLLRLLALEGLLVTLGSAAVGVVAGLGYAALMIHGLQTWWLPAIGTPFLRLHAAPSSYVFGYLGGIVAALVAIAWTLWRMRRIAVRRLLAGQAADSNLARPKRRPLLTAVQWLGLVGALAAIIAARGLSGEAQAGAFLGGGFGLLASLLAMIARAMYSGRTGPLVTARGAIAQLALRNASRNPGRSLTTIALVALATFLIVGLSAFRAEPTAHEPKRNDGTGGYALVAESDQPIYHDLDTADGRLAQGFTPEESAELDGSHIVACRVRPGDDASCLNLYQVSEPRVVGASQRLIERGGFAWAATDAKSPAETENPWRSLERDLPNTADGLPQVPAVIDFATAVYSLHLPGSAGGTLEITDGSGQRVRLIVVGLLAGSVLQGDVIVSDANFVRLFPSESGRRLFLIETAAGKQSEVAGALEAALGDWGLDVQSSTARLEGFLAVQNTYLSTFQSLGGLGLLLGTFGLAAIELRSVLERRGELALMRAVGFRRRRLAWLVMCEQLSLLVMGLLVGTLAALLAVGPHWWQGGASVPWAWLGGALATVVLLGVVTGLWAVRAVVREPLLSALRSG